MKLKKSDHVTLVNEQDQVIGSMDKIEAHCGGGKLHRAISVFLFRRDKTGALELLLQQRSDQKIVGARQWANTVCGNVWPEESYEECARRRLEFELNITQKIPLTDIFIFRYQVQCNQEFGENEIDHIFVGWFDGKLKPNPEEVTATQWFAWERAKKLDKSVSNWSPWFKKMMQDSQVVNALEKNAQ